MKKRNSVGTANIPKTSVDTMRAHDLIRFIVHTEDIDYFSIPMCYFTVTQIHALEQLFLPSRIEIIIRGIDDNDELPSKIKDATPTEVLTAFLQWNVIYQKKMRTKAKKDREVLDLLLQKLRPNLKYDFSLVRWFEEEGAWFKDVATPVIDPIRASWMTRSWVRMWILTELDTYLNLTSQWEIAQLYQSVKTQDSDGNTNTEGIEHEMFVKEDIS